VFVCVCLHFQIDIPAVRLRALMGVHYSTLLGVYSSSHSACDRLPLVGPGVRHRSNVRLRGEGGREAEREGGKEERGGGGGGEEGRGECEELE